MLVVPLPPREAQPCALRYSCSSSSDPILRAMGAS
jgi:hypothetical protein